MLYSSLTRSETRALRTISSTLWTSAVDCIRKNEATKFSTLIVDYHIADMEEHRALSDARQEWILYRAMRDEAELLGML